MRRHGIAPIDALWGLVLLSLLCEAAAAADWPQILGPNRDGHSRETGLNWNWGPDGPPVLWSRPVGAGFAGVAVAGNLAVLFHRVEDQELLLALDPKTGKELWNFAAPTRYRDDFNFDPGPRCVPLIVGETIFALGANGDLHAVEAATGKKRWHRNLRDDYAAPKGFFGVAATPILIQDRLLVNVGGPRAGIVAFDPASGKELWKATDDPASYSSPTAATIQGHLRAIFLTRTGLVVLDPTNGKVQFQRYFRSRLDASVNAATPLVWNDQVFLTASYGVGAALWNLAGTEIEEIWANDRTLSCQYNTPVRVGDYLYGVDGRADLGNAKLRCVEWATGKIRWNRDNFGVAALIAVDGSILAVTEAGELVAFHADPEAYRERARVRVLSKPTRALPALADGRLFLRDEKNLVCLNLK